LKTLGRALGSAVSTVLCLASQHAEVRLFCVTVKAHLRDYIAKNLVRPFETAGAAVDSLTSLCAVERLLGFAIFTAFRHNIAEPLLGSALASTAAAQQALARLQTIHRFFCLTVVT
jgi:hypothetical protein